MASLQALVRPPTLEVINLAGSQRLSTSFRNRLTTATKCAVSPCKFTQSGKAVSAAGLGARSRVSSHRCPQGRTFGASWRSSSRSTPGVCRAAVAADPEYSADGFWTPPVGAPPLSERVRALAFYLLTFSSAVPLFLMMLVVYPAVMVFDKLRRRAMHIINAIWAMLTTGLFYSTEIIGWDNLPPAEQSAVYVANHQSFLDIYTLFQVARPFKFISKTTNFVIPIIGWAMYLTGHVPLKRDDKRSQMECLKHCQRLLETGVSVLFFPEGTRTSDGKLAKFKKGAFSLAAKTGAPVVPITLIGTGKLMPNGRESTLRTGRVRVIIHPQIKGTDAEQMMTESRKIIADTLVAHGLGVH